MKQKYSKILKESLINFDQMQKSSHTVNDIINYKGGGTLPTHKKANNVVSVLERMYQQEDGDMPVLREGEETEVAQGATKPVKINPDTPKTTVGKVATTATGVAHPNPDDSKEFSDTIQDANKDDKTLATESAEDSELEEFVEEAVFEEGDEEGAGAEDQGAEIEENLETEPDHEAQGDEARDVKIGDGGASLSNDATLGDDEVDGMEEHSKGIPKENKLPAGTNVNEETEEADLKESDDADSDDAEAEDLGADDETDKELEALPGEEDTDTAGIEEEMQEVGDEEEVGDEVPEADDAGAEVPETDEEDVGGDEDVDDGMGDDEECEDCTNEGEAQGQIGVDSEAELPADAAGDEEPQAAEGEEAMGAADPTDDELSRIPGEEDPAAEETGEEEAPTLDVDQETSVQESIVARNATEETIVERLIREMNLETESASDLDEVDLDDDDAE